MASNTSLPPIELGENSIVVSGAGLAGSLLACHLSQKGLNVNVIERRPDPRKEVLQAGRSINLALSERGINAMREVGILEDVMKITIPMYCRAIHLPGECFFGEMVGHADVVCQQYSHDGKSCIYSVSRAELNVRLLDLAEKAGAKFHFGRTVRRLNTRTGDMTIDGTAKLKTKTVIAADGAFSPCRHSIINAPFVNYSQKYMDHGYKELVIPATHAHGLKKNALHIWPRGTFMMIALPNMDGSYTCTLFMPYKGGFDTIKSKDDVIVFFQQHFSDALPLMPTLTDDFMTNPTGSLVTVKCYPWSFGSHLTMVGDAAHAVVPFFGQGMNASFEDVFVLNALLEKSVGKDTKLEAATIPWASIFDQYQKLRKDNADAIADLAEANYIEMRDKVADADYQLIKKICDKLGNLFPGQFISRYEMVSFSNIPYTMARDKGQIGEDIARELAKSWDGEKFDQVKAAQLVNAAFAPGWIHSINTDFNSPTTKL